MAAPTVEADPPLRVARLARGLSLRALEREVRISRSHLSRVERGQGSLSVPAALRLAKALGVDLGWLLREVSR